jgi:hypothetical protein
MIGRIAPIAFAVFTLGCMHMRRDVQSFDSLRADEVVLAGRIDLVPPLRPEEQNIGSISPYELENTAYLMLDDEARALKGTPTQADLQGSIGAPLGQLFMVAIESRPKFIVGASIVLSVGRGGHETADLPGGFWVDVRPGDKAVYIGTLRYFRNEFFEILRVDVIDDFAYDGPAFVQRFGSAYPLHKRLARAGGTGQRVSFGFGG